MKNKNYLSDQIRNNIPKRNIEEGRESVRMFVEMLKKRTINVIDEAILNRAYEEEDYVDEKMPVSYTHLDVYKRQVPFHRIGKCGLEQRVDFVDRGAGQ